MITLQNYHLNPLHVAAISPAVEATAQHPSSSYSFVIVLSGGNELIFLFDSKSAAQEELIRICQLVDQASTRR